MIAEGPDREAALPDPVAGVIARHAPRLMALPGVTGIGEGRSAGAPCIILYLSPESVAAGLPAELDGYPVIIRRAGPFRPQGEA